MTLPKDSKTLYNPFAYNMIKADRDRFDQVVSDIPRVAASLACGTDASVIADECQIPVKRIHFISRLPITLSLMAQFHEVLNQGLLEKAKRADVTPAEMLMVEAELEAAATVVNLMGSHDQKISLAAAQTLLKMRGYDKPTEVLLSTNLSAAGEQQLAHIHQALMDLANKGQGITADGQGDDGSEEPG